METGWLRAARAAAPWLAVALGWVWLSSALAAMIAYHLQTLAWLAADRARARRDAVAGLGARPGGGGQARRGPAPPAWRWRIAAYALVGPAVFVIAPLVAEVPLPDWLAQHGLAGWGLVAMVPYFGLVHPWLEQRHWAPLWSRDSAPSRAAMVAAFAGYHAVVLWSLLPTWAVAVVVLGLAAASLTWAQMARRAGLRATTASHVLADLGMVLAAVALAAVG